MFNLGRRYEVSHTVIKPVVEQKPLLPEPPPPSQKVKGKGLDELIDKIKTVNLRQNTKNNKKITF
jgi:hypothetical protein